MGYADGFGPDIGRRLGKPWTLSIFQTQHLRVHWHQNHANDTDGGAMCNFGKCVPVITNCILQISMEDQMSYYMIMEKMEGVTAS